MCYCCFYLTITVYKKYLSSSKPILLLNDIHAVIRYEKMNNRETYRAAGSDYGIRDSRRVIPTPFSGCIGNTITDTALHRITLLHGLLVLLLLVVVG